MRLKTVLLLALVAPLGACVSTHTSRVTFPSPDEMFITSGDGNIQKPYTPVGEIIHYKTGFRLPAPLLGMVPLADVDPDQEIRTTVLSKVREMGGDALINMRVNWTPPSNGFLGIGAKGGFIVVTGTAIKR